MNVDVLIFGVNGMLGNTLFSYFSEMTSINVIGILRDINKLPIDFKYQKSKNIFTFEFINESNLKKILCKFNPKVVINCVGIVKRHPDSENPRISILINSLFPHLLNEACSLINAKLIHISTDCVFSGKDGFYNEKDYPDSNDLYGRTKLLGEVITNNAITLRTSYIGRELVTERGLLSWFIAQKKTIKGFSKAVFSGLPTVEIARIINEFVIPNKNLNGLYHLSSNPIDKFTLLNLINSTYKLNKKIEKDSEYIINRSLDSTRFREATGYKPLEWEKAIRVMKDFGEK